MFAEHVKSRVLAAENRVHPILQDLASIRKLVHAQQPAVQSTPFANLRSAPNTSGMSKSNEPWERKVFWIQEPVARRAAMALRVLCAGNGTLLVMSLTPMSGCETHKLRLNLPFLLRKHSSCVC